MSWFLPSVRGLSYGFLALDRFAFASFMFSLDIFKRTLLILEGNILISSGLVSVSSFHKLEDDVDTIVVRPVVTFLIHSFGQFFVGLAEVGMIDDA